MRGEEEHTGALEQQSAMMQLGLRAEETAGLVLELVAGGGCCYETS